ncbi:hypothetical protein SFRURICE_008348, partial [Spodoptera frugiperda]
MLPGDGRRSGIAMDMANKYANELLQRGKTALESAKNMNREFKQTAIECLQSLYETCLALSDSRSRHMLSLEREKSRHAREIIVIERAHNKKIAETNGIRSWLGYETLEPYKRIEDILKSTTEIKTTVAGWNHSRDLPTKTLIEAELQPLKDQQTRLFQTVNTLSQQLDELRRGQDKALESTTTLQTMSEEIQVWLSSREQSASTENTTQSQQRIEEDLVGLEKDLQPITERLDAVSSELRTMRQLKERTPPPPAPSVCTEMALADIVKQIRKPTYAQVASKPSVPRPNHTLIISSTDPKNTGDNVIEKIRVALDCKKTGAKVEKVRKAKNQKVIEAPRQRAGFRGGTKEDM